MNRDDRPDPDLLLKRVSSSGDGKGRLRIFLGMSAGVGKTYAMLKAAHQKKKENVNVVVGIVETHGRSETMALVENLKVIPRKKIEYKKTFLEEMDLDQIIELNPKIVLVDELAHTNAPGSRHPKRYQDVIELLDRGIDVYTTINVQHLESRKEAVEAIAQIAIRETVPDSIIERADLVEVVDIAPSELLKRLSDGKVYLGDKADRAAQNFFREDKLTALREIALRLTAERVDQDLRKLSDVQTKTISWHTNERLMVAISHSPSSERIIRAARRMAYSLEAPWIAVHVDDGSVLSTIDQNQLAKNIAMARELNAEVITTMDLDVADALKRISLQKNVTQIIVGRSVQRKWLDFLPGRNTLDRMISEIFDVDIHIIATTKDPDEKNREKYQRNWKPSFKIFISYWYTAWFIGAVALSGVVMESLVGYRTVGFFFLLGVLVVGLLSSMGAVLFSAVLSVLTWNFFFIPPRFTFAVSKPEDVIMCISYLVVATIVGFLTNRVRLHERVIREREDRTNILYEISQDIASSRDKTEFLSKINERVGKILVGNCGVFLRGKNGKLMVDEKKPYIILLSEKEKAVASWTFGTGKSAGWSTNTLSESKALYIPLTSMGEILGVFVYQPLTKKKLSLDQQNLLFSIVGQISVSLEKHFFEKRLRESEKLVESEKLHQALLNSISHELRTPLTVIMGTATSLGDPQTIKNPSLVEKSAGHLLQASERLNQVIENLLDMSRLNSGMLTLKLELHDLHDLIGVVLQKIKNQTLGHKIVVNLPEGLPLVPMDFRMMEHAISNIVANASIYTSVGTHIEIGAKILSSSVEIVIEDNGPGVAEEFINQIFNKFYRVPGSKTGGTGLGLSITQSIIESHKGKIRGENKSTGGLRFVINLPLQNSSTKNEENQK